ncbi:MAG: hypothetical protein HWD58_19320 [Bacteroidota bacterium]|nr:MAG: hypothetical protein HWD58_19320 [Bacteroidota bacterium]
MSKQRQANQHVILKGTGDKSQVTNFGAAKEVKNCRLVILLPADLRVEITAKSKRNGGSHIVANVPGIAEGGVG